MKEALHMRMFGGFSLTWKGKPLAGKSRESQFVYLMQSLLHCRETGVSRDRMEELLFGERELENVHHAMQSVVYNAKKRLRLAGLPEGNYIELRQGVFYWTGEVPVVEDAREFERLCREADAQKDAEEKLECLCRALRLYRGEFLPTQAAVPWAAREAKRYRGMFCARMEEAAALLRKVQGFVRMEELGRHAAAASPLSGWETVTMEALLSMGRQEEAWKLYEETTEYYLREQGVRPPRELSCLLEKLGGGPSVRRAGLEEIQTDLAECAEGGYLCSYPVFEGICQMAGRMMERGGQSVCLMLCTVVDSKGNPMREGAALAELSARLEEAIRTAVRRTDAAARYREGQYLVLLVNTTLEDCRIVQKRIDGEFLVGRQRTGISYQVGILHRAEDRKE